MVHHVNEVIIFDYPFIHKGYKHNLHSRILVYQLEVHPKKIILEVLNLIFFSYLLSFYIRWIEMISEIKITIYLMLLQKEKKKS